MIPKPKPIAITPAQAQHLASLGEAAKSAARDAEAAKNAFRYAYSLLIAGHVPETSTFVSVETDEGWLTVQPPEVPDLELVADVDENGG